MNVRLVLNNGYLSIAFARVETNLLEDINERLTNSIDLINATEFN